MLKQIQKFFKQPSEAQDQKDPEEMSQKESQPELTAQLATALEQITKQAADLQALTELVEELSAASDASKAALAASEAAKALLVQEAATKRLQARKEAVEAAVGTVKAPALLAATDALDDTQFKAIVDAMATSLSNEAGSALFKEVGVSAKSDTSEVVKAAEETLEAKQLRAKYKKQ